MPRGRSASHYAREVEVPMSHRFAKHIAGAALVLGASVAHADAHAPSDSVTWTIVIEIAERRVLVIARDGDIRQVMPAAVGSGKTLEGDDRIWTFNTPTGVTSVTKKEKNPAWIPPDWHYIEVAAGKGFSVEKLQWGRERMLSDGKRLAIQGGYVGVIIGDDFYALSVDEEIVFDDILFIPPFGTKNRSVGGILGPYRLVLANGIGIHGTPLKESIGKAATHGCIRLHDADITWLYENIPIGTPVIIR